MDAPGAATKALHVPAGSLESFYRVVEVMAEVLIVIVSREQRVVPVSAPVYVMGDLHGAVDAGVVVCGSCAGAEHLQCHASVWVCVYGVR